METPDGCMIGIEGVTAFALTQPAPGWTAWLNYGRLDTNATSELLTLDEHESDGSEA